MSSPDISNAGTGEIGGTAENGHKKPLEQIAFRFCGECSNMLYPREDETARKLMFTCRTCQYSEEAQTSCIYRNVLNNAVSETAGVTQDVASDPTVGASLPSPSSASHLACLDASAACVGVGGVGVEGGGGADLAASLCLGCGCVIACVFCGHVLTTSNNTATHVRHGDASPRLGRTDLRSPQSRSQANSTSSGSRSDLSLGAWMAEEEERINDYIGEDEIDGDIGVARC